MFFAELLIGPPKTYLVLQDILEKYVMVQIVIFDMFNLTRYIKLTFNYK